MRKEREMKHGMKFMTMVKVVLVVVIGVFVLAGVSMCSNQPPKNTDPKAITQILGDDGKPVEIPADALAAAVAKDVQVSQKPIGEVVAHDCHGEDPETAGDPQAELSVPVQAKVGQVVRCQVQMTTADGRQVDQYQMGHVIKFERNDPASVVVKF